MEQQRWFATPIWHEHSNLDTTNIANKCVKMMEEKFPHRDCSNIGGWQSQDIDLNDFNEFKELNSYIINCLNKVASDIHPKVKLKLSKSWININFPGSHNVGHMHPGYFISGVFYALTEEQSGNIIFDSGSRSKKHKINVYDSNLFSHNTSYKPINGMIVLFPSWLEHEVKTNNSSQNRISIAFDARQVFEA